MAKRSLDYVTRHSPHRIRVMPFGNEWKICELYMKEESAAGFAPGWGFSGRKIYGLGINDLHYRTRKEAQKVLDMFARVLEWAPYEEEEHEQDASEV